jgi:hypothetical protein
MALWDCNSDQLDERGPSIGTIPSSAVPPVSTRTGMTFRVGGTTYRLTVQRGAPAYAATLNRTARTIVLPANLPTDRRLDCLIAGVLDAWRLETYTTGVATASQHVERVSLFCNDLESQGGIKALVTLPAMVATTTAAQPRLALTR